MTEVTAPPGPPGAGLLGIELRTTSSPVGLAVEDLVRLAVRRNPRRAHLLVSTVLGKHLPVDPRLVAATGRLLGGLIRCTLDGVEVPTDWPAAARAAVAGDPEPLLTAIPAATVPTDLPTVTSWRGANGPVVLGYAETATALGNCVADALGARIYLHSTRRPSEQVPVYGTFEEGHSHATTHLLLPSSPRMLDGDDPLVLVDDELSTGRTAMATIAELTVSFPERRRFVVGALVDLRSAEDDAQMASWATDLGISVDVVALARGTVALPEDILLRAAAHLAAHTAEPAPVPPTTPGPIRRIDAGWPAGLRQGGRFGLVDGARPAFQTAVAGLVDAVDAALPAAARRILVLGTEELMFLPMTLAIGLGATGSGRQVWFQSTTRSPVHPEIADDYPVRRAIGFAAADGTPRFCYNAGVGAAGTEEADAIVVVTDDEPGEVVAALAALGVPVVQVALPAERIAPNPLSGPGFGSYPAEEVTWLLTDLSHAALEGEVADRERRIQAGAEHYAESLPVEYQPSASYQRLYREVLASSADRLATAVGLLTELVLAERGEQIVLASLARAGTPVGLLMRRWAARRGLDLPHYAVSIVRARGIDPAALEHLAAHHDPADVVFVDGWTGKGAITVELEAALQEFAATGGATFDPAIAVLADPGSCTRWFGTRDDFLIASACLNSTVSGLVSRTVLNASLTSPQQFHGAKFYAELAGVDVSLEFVDTISGRFDAVADAVAEQLPALLAADRTPTFAGWRAVERIQQQYGLPSINLVKPGVGETTRVLLRRVPWKILVREADHPDHAHLRLLAAERGVPVEVVPELPYACLGLIKPMESDG